MVAFVGVQQTSATPTTPTVANSPWALTWARDSRADNAWTSAGATRRSAFMFYAATGGAAPGSDTFDIDLGGVTNIGAEAICVAITGADLSAGPLAALVQAVPGIGAVSLMNNVTLSAAANAANRTLAFFELNSTTPTINQEAGYTELTEVSHTAPTIRAECCWNPTAFDTTPSASSSDSIGYASGQLGIELAAQLDDPPAIAMQTKVTP